MRRNLPLLACLCLMILLVGLRRAQAQELLAERDPAIDRLPPQVLGRLESMAVVGEFSIAELVQYTVEHRQIHAEVRLSQRLAERVNAAAPGAARIAVRGSDRIWTVRSVRDGRFARTGALELACYDPHGSSPFQRITLTTCPGTTYLDGSDFAVPDRPRPAHLTLIAGPGPMRLLSFLPVTRFQPNQLLLENLDDLRTRQRPVAEHYVEPMLRVMGAASLLHRRPAADVYRLFPDIPADPAVLARVEPLVQQLDSTAPAERESATLALRRLGRPAVLALLRLDTLSLSPEQSARVKTVLAADDWRAIGDVSSAQRDLHVLLDCLDDEDRAVRRAAKAGIEELRGRPLQFDPDAPAEARAAAVDRMLDELRRTDRMRERLRAR